MHFVGFQLIYTLLELKSTARRDAEQGTSTENWRQNRLAQDVVILIHTTDQPACPVDTPQTYIIVHTDYLTTPYQLRNVYIVTLITMMIWETCG